MKKIYSVPAIQETPMDMRHAIAEGSVKSDNDHGIKYGGVDQAGSKDPDSNRRNDADWGNLW